MSFVRTLPLGPFLNTISIMARTTKRSFAEVYNEKKALYERKKTMSDLDHINKKTTIENEKKKKSGP